MREVERLSGCCDLCRAAKQPSTLAGVAGSEKELTKGDPAACGRGRELCFCMPTQPSATTSVKLQGEAAENQDW